MTLDQAVPQLHPLFDRASLYRLAAEESVFLKDNGEQSLYDSFHDQRRRELHRAWMFGPPSEPQDWGFDPLVNQMLHAGLSRRSQKQPVVHATREAHVDHSPALLVYRFDDGREAAPPTPLRTSRVSPFTGCGEVDRFRDIHDFEVRLNPENVPDLPDGHIVLLLLATPSLIRMLRRILDAGEATALPPLTANLDEAAAIDTLSQALDASVLANRRERRRAARIAQQLASSPALQGIVRNGEFHCRLSLDSPCPPLDDDTYVALCVGPRIEPPSRPELT